MDQLKQSTVYFDINCPFCFILSEWIDTQCLTGNFNWTGIEHAPHLNSSTNTSTSEQTLLQEEISSALLRVEGVRIKKPPFRPNSLLPLAILEYIKINRLFYFYQAKQKLGHALWLDGKDISSPDVLSAVLSDIPSLDFTRINLEKEISVVKNNTRIWRNAGYNRIPMITASTNAEYLGLGNRELLESFYLSGITEHQDLNTCLSGEPSGQQSDTALSQDSAISDDLTEELNYLPMLRQMIEQTNESVVLLDSSLKVLVCNKNTLKLSGLNYSQCIGQSLKKISGVENFALFSKALSESVTGRFTICLSHSGKEQTTEVSYNRFSKQNSNFTVVSFRDISDRINNELSLKKQKEEIEFQKTIVENKQKFSEQLISSLRDIIIVTRGDGTIVYTNDLVSAKLGYEKFGTHGMLITELAEDKVYFQNEIFGPSRKGVDLNVKDEEISVLKKDGRVLPCLLSCFLTRTFFDGEENIIFILQDCSESNLLKKLQNKRLQLMEAQKLEAIGLLAGGIAHDFNNLVTIISGTTDILGRTDVPESLKNRKLQTMKEASVRMQSMAKSLLSYGSKNNTSRETVRLLELMEENVSMLKNVLPSGSTLRLDYVDPHLTVTVNISEFNQLLLNLVVNARDAFADESGVITLSATCTTLKNPVSLNSGNLESGSYTCIRVQDNGVGIEDKHLRNLFRPFFTTKEEGKGTGLGLATVKRIMENSGGGVEIQSRPGNGTTFILYFPKNQ